VQTPLYILTEMLGYLLLGPRQLLYIAGGWRGPSTGSGLGRGRDTSPENSGTFSLEIIIISLFHHGDHFGANSVVF